MRSALRAATRLALIGSMMSCGGPYATPPAQTPSAPTTPTDVADVRGKWTGTVQGTNLSAQSVTMDVVQTADCVDGAWNTDADQWAGAISGYAAKGSFSGLMTFERVAGGPRCTAYGNVAGEVTGTSLRWTSIDALTGDCPADTLPQAVVLTMHRQ